MTRLSLFILLILSAIFLLLLGLSVTNPHLYTIRSDPATLFHTNPQALSHLPQEKSVELYSIMQNLLDSPHPIVLNLKIKDFEDAEAAYAEYQEKSRYFDSLVVNLEISESIVGDFQRLNRVNLAALEQMINGSARFETINQLEIRYRTENKPYLLYTNTYEGEAVQQTLSRTGDLYTSLSPAMLEISRNIGLNTEKYEESVETMRELVAERELQQQERRTIVPGLRQNTFNLDISPRAGRYGDILEITGALSPSSGNASVTLFLDSQELKAVIPNEYGIFQDLFLIEKIRAGDHLLYGTSGSLYSSIVSFTVSPSDTTLTLDVERGENWDELICSGILSTKIRGVAGAPVGIYTSGEGGTTVDTAEDGSYSAVLTLPEGAYNIQAVFYDPAFPLNSSTSPVETVVISPQGDLTLNLVVSAGIFLLFSTGGIMYLRRSKGRKKGPIPVESDLIDEQNGETEKYLPETVLEPWDVRYRELVEGDDWSGAAHHLYLNLREQLALRYKLPRHHAMTPREIVTTFTYKPVSSPLATFVSRYEEIRYGGIRPSGGDDELLSAWQAALGILQEGSHE
jgi:hypothetical protein